MKSALPTNLDIRKLILKKQRKKNVIPEHAVTTEKLNEEIVELYQALQTLTSDAMIAKFEAELRRKLDSKSKFDDALVEETRSKIEDYLINPPRTVRLKLIHQDSRDVITWNKRRTTLEMFDKFCAQKLKESFGVKYLGRDQAIRVLIDGLVGTEDIKKHSHRSIIRADIRQFYESIDRGILIGKVKQHSGVPKYVIDHIARISDAMARMNKKFEQYGIPNGISSSAALAEIYLENLDRKIISHPAVGTYIRYNDDIVIICESDHSAQTEEMLKQELKALSLEPSQDKFKKSIITHPVDVRSEFEYLGYRFQFREVCGRLEQIDISTAKRNRLERAVDNIVTFAKRSPCIAKPSNNRILYNAVAYLIRPHYSDPGLGASRIISGLAYSSRFINLSPSESENFKHFVNYADKELKRNILSKIDIKSDPASCKCCGQPVSTDLDLARLVSKMIKSKHIMKSPAVKHVDHSERREARKLLWI